MQSPRSQSLLSTLVLVCVALLGAAPLAAQVPAHGGGAGEPPNFEKMKPGEKHVETLPDGSRIVRIKKEDGSMEEKHVPPGVGDDGEPLPPHLMEARMRGAHASTYFTAMAMIQPARLGPGQNGHMCIVVNLLGNGVVLPSGQKKLTYKLTQDGLNYGVYSLEKAKRGELKTIYRGKPVFDNTMVFKIPVTVPQGQKHGRLPFRADLEMEVHHAKTGSRIGMERTTVEGMVVVGRPLPKPQVPDAPIKPEGKARVGAKTAAGKTAKGPSGQERPGNKSGPGKAAGTESPQGAMTKSQNGKADATAGGTETEESEADASGSGLPYWLGGGGLVVVVILILLFRRK